MALCLRLLRPAGRCADLHRTYATAPLASSAIGDAVIARVVAIVIVVVFACMLAIAILVVAVVAVIVIGRGIVLVFSIT